MKRHHNSRTAVITTLALVLLSAAGLSFIQAQGFKSPRGSAEVTLAGKKISVDYGRPSMHDRKVMGGLVPFDQVWRLGANKATHLTTEADLVIGNVNVPKGTYSLFAVPGQSSWKLIINKVTGQWGIPYKPEYEKEELGRVDMKVEALGAPVEEFTILLEGSGNNGTIKAEWEKTRASVKFTAK